MPAVMFWLALAAGAEAEIRQLRLEFIAAFIVHAPSSDSGPARLR